MCEILQVCELQCATIVCNRGLWYSMKTMELVITRLVGGGFFCHLSSIISLLLCQMSLFTFDCYFWDAVTVFFCFKWLDPLLVRAHDLSSQSLLPLPLTSLQ